MASSQFLVAVIGMVTKQSGDETLEKFLDLLKSGGNTVAKFTQEQEPDIENAVVPFREQLVVENDNYLTSLFLKSEGTFDAKLLGINPKEDPFIESEKKFLLETIWEAIKDAGCISTIRGSSTGVYVGNSVNKYKYNVTENHPSISHSYHPHFISCRVSNIHNLQGPTMTLATACSSSLLTVHSACQGLLSGDCDTAIAEGITLDLLPIYAKTDNWNQLGITRPRVKCRAFDTFLNGIAKGQDCGVVVLKPSDKAEMHGDQIYGVLQALTPNHDGHSKGITEPYPLCERKLGLGISWMEVLQTDKAPEDSENFAQCGGNSFNAVYLVSMLSHLCAIEISTVTLLQNHTYAEIKDIVKGASGVSKEKASPLCLEHDPLISLSAAQELIVLGQQTNHRSAAYVETLAFRTNKATDPKQIISSLVQKHPILKSKITIKEETLKYSWSILTVMNIEVKHEFVVSRNITEDFLKRTTPALKVVDSTLFKTRFITAKEDSVLALHIHRVVADNVTLHNIARDFEELMHKGILSDLEPTNIEDYANYIEQEETYLKSKKRKDDEQFWTKKFENLPPDSNLSISSKADSTSFKMNYFQAKHTIRALPEQAVVELAAYCRVQGITEFHYLLSCTTLVLQRYLGVDEITLAVPVSTRTGNHMITDGLFENTVLFRITVNHSLTFKEHIQAVGAQWLETLSHSNYPLNQVAKALWKTHGKKSGSFCSVMFNYTVRRREAGELRILARDAKMPLSLNVERDQQSRKMLIVAEWADQLIEDGIVERLIKSLFQLCTTAYREGEKSLYQVQVLCNEEHSLLTSFSTTSNDAPAEVCLPVHLSFEEFAKANPHTTAVAIDDRRLSYRELDELSSRISNALLCEVNEERLQISPVVIVADKSEFSIAAILGIWKTGGHFLPVASTNQSTLKNIIARNKPAAIVTDLPTNFAQEENQSCPLFLIEDLIQSPNYQSNDACPNVTAENLAYIIQTSGSTGTPKQCKITHRSLRIIANAWKVRYAMKEFKVNVLQWAALSFDVFVGDVVKALVCAPGQLTICPDERRLDIPYILNLVKKHQITMVEVTPLFGQQLVENAHHEQLSSMKVFILGSDVLQRSVYHTVKNKLRKDQKVFNSYGMTEATIDSAFFEGDIVPTTRSGTVPIGKPLPGVRLNVLDPKTLLPCPVGTIGELYISGDVLASGDVDLLPVSYLSCHALKTGDSACYLPSGDIELLGRMDNIMKLRGFRISKAEIENKIMERIETVTQACVVLQQDENDTGIEFLCAFLVVEQVDTEDTTIDRSYVCSKLKDELPYYMLPDIVYIIPEIPLSINGKVNTKALPKVSILKESIVAPSVTANVESSIRVIATLKELFAEALGLPDSKQVDLHLTFMEQGSHSLVLVKFSTLITKKTPFHVTIADIFAYPTISALEEFISQETKKYV